MTAFEVMQARVPHPAAAGRGTVLRKAGCCYEPRQEPGRYFLFSVVPAPPQVQLEMPLPMSLAVVEGALAEFSGNSVTSESFTSALMFCTVAVTEPLVSVAIAFTYFDVTPCSQPQPLATGGVPPVW